jgi:hypothetical protein
VRQPTIRVEGPHRAAGLERFGRFFTGQLWDVYGPGRGPANQHRAVRGPAR